MGISKAEYNTLLLRRGNRRSAEPAREGVCNEMSLHDDIMGYCRNQFPQWKYIRARSDMASTIQVGAQDFTIFMPNGKVLCVECKSRTGKIKPEQAGWALEMERLGHKVHVVRSMAEFLAVVSQSQLAPI